MPHGDLRQQGLEVRWSPACVGTKGGGRGEGRGETAGPHGPLPHSSRRAEDQRTGLGTQVGPSSPGQPAGPALMAAWHENRMDREGKLGHGWAWQKCLVASHLGTLVWGCLGHPPPGSVVELLTYMAQGRPL